MNLGSGINVASDGYVGGWRVVNVKETPPPTYPSKRECACGAVLSIYNPDSHCAACEPERWAAH